MFALAQGQNAHGVRWIYKDIVHEVGSNGEAVEHEDLDATQNIGAAQVGKDTAERARVETSRMLLSVGQSGLQWVRIEASSLVLGQVLVQLDVAPRLAAAIDPGEVKPG